MKMESNTFLHRINRGDEEAFKVLFDLYYTKLVFFASEYVGNRSVAEEIVQDTFVTIWNRREDIQSNINGYLYKTTKNACLDHLKSKSFKLNAASNLLQLEAFINLKALSHDTSSALIEKELKQSINRAISLLPEKCRNVFVKSRMEGKKHKEISEELDISVKTVENHISRAIKHLRFHLKDFLTFF